MNSYLMSQKRGQSSQLRTSLTDLQLCLRVVNCLLKKAIVLISAVEHSSKILISGFSLLTGLKSLVVFCTSLLVIF